jgi:hypothetical protein
MWMVQVSAVFFVSISSFKVSYPYPVVLNRHAKLHGVFYQEVTTKIDVKD